MAASVTAHGGTIDIYFVVPPRVLLLDLAGPAEAFRIASAGNGRFRLNFVGPGPQPLTSLGLGLTGIQPLPAALPDAALVMLVGASESFTVFATPQADAIVHWLRKKVRATHRICCVCAGAILAARAGLLDGRRCTTHHDLCDRLAGKFPAVQVEKNRIFVQDGNVYTSAGVTAGIDLSLFLISELASPQIAAETARELVVYFRRSGEDPQLSPWLMYRNHLHPGVHRVQDLIIRAPGKPWRLQDIADEAHMSVRNLTRAFRQVTGESVNGYLQHIRVASAKQLLAGTPVTIERAAEMAGFASARDLRRVWKKFEPGSPLAVRQRQSSTPGAGT